MDALIIEGPAQLKGSVDISGSKNAALPLLFSSILFDEEIRFKNVPRLWDIETTLSLLETMGAEFSWEKDEGTISILPSIKTKMAPYEWVRRMRAGILALGPLVAKYGEAKVSLPGGCAIGARPVNFHIDAMKQMGISVEVEQGYIKAQVPKRISGAHIVFPQVTVTGTENLMILACHAEGATRIENAAQEPEIVALGEVLNRCGAKISGLGTPVLEIEARRLNPPVNPISIPPDRIETGTWISASVASRSELLIRNCDSAQLTSIIQAYRRLGTGIDVLSDGAQMKIRPPDRYEALELETAPYPGFPTDMQAQMLANLCLAWGKSRLRETIFENRFMHVAELRRLGAKISVQGNVAEVDGPSILQGAPMMATDLRASASLIVAALSAHGQTKISRIYHLDRGYQRLDRKLSALGARVTRIIE